MRNSGNDGNKGNNSNGTSPKLANGQTQYNSILNFVSLATYTVTIVTFVTVVTRFLRSTGIILYYSITSLLYHSYHNNRGLEC